MERRNARELPGWSSLADDAGFVAAAAGENKTRQATATALSIGLSFLCDWPEQASGQGESGKMDAWESVCRIPSSYQVVEIQCASDPGWKKGSRLGSVLREAAMV